MSTSYIFLAGALFLFVIAIVILFMGKGKKDDKKVDKEFDEKYQRGLFKDRRCQGNTGTDAGFL